MKYDYKKIKESYLLLLQYEFSCSYDYDLSDEEANYLYENIVLGGEGSRLLNDNDLEACKDEIEYQKDIEKQYTIE